MLRPRSEVHPEDNVERGGRMILKRVRIVSVLCLAATLLAGATAPRLAGQANTAAILGTVTDASGAAVPDATVKVTNTGTSASEVAMGHSQGRYRVPALAIGDYQVECEKSGFNAVVQKGITLSV